MTRQFMIVLLLFTLILSFSASSMSEELVVGYYRAWTREAFPPDKIDFNIVTHVIHAFAWPEADGSISTYENCPDPELVSAAHKAGRKVMIAFGGWGNCEGFPPMSADPAIRAKFVENVMEFCRKNGYDGVDLDWEFPANPEERDNLSVLVADLRKAADALGKPFLITMAISAGSWSGDHNDYEALADNIDWLNDMTYDFYGTWTDRAGHNAPLYASQESVNSSVMMLMRKFKMPPEKIMLGLPFYGRRFKTESLYGPSIGGDGVSYNSIVKLMNEGGWKYNWDDVSMVPYLVNEAETELLTYDTPESIAIKCAYAKDMKLRGMMIWALGGDYIDGSQPLLNAIGAHVDVKKP